MRAITATRIIEDPSYAAHRDIFQDEARMDAARCECAILQVMADRMPLTVGEISDATCLPRSDVSKALHHLGKDKLVFRHNKAVDEDTVTVQWILADGESL